MNRLLLSVIVAMGFSLSASGQEDGKIYHIKNLNSGKVLAPDGEGKLVQKTSRPMIKLQQWKLVKGRAEGAFQIANVATEKRLTSPSKDQGAQVTIEDAAAKMTPSQGWKFDRRPRGFVITSLTSGFVLDVEGLQTEDGAAVIQYPLKDKKERSNQIWELVPVE